MIKIIEKQRAMLQKTGGLKEKKESLDRIIVASKRIIEMNGIHKKSEDENEETKSCSRDSLTESGIGAFPKPLMH